MNTAQDACEEPARSSAGRDLARARWTPSPVLARAVATVVERSADLDEIQRAELGAAIGGEAASGDG